MIAELEVREAADRAAERLLLDELDVAVTETDTSWAYVFTPKGRVRGGGFRLTVSKESGRVIDVLRYQ